MAKAGPTTDHEVIRSWAIANNAVPAEVLPHVLDHEPATLRICTPEMVSSREDMRVITWEDFFIKFDLLGLAFVYDEDSTGYNELLQIDEKSPYRNENHRVDYKH